MLRIGCITDDFPLPLKKALAVSTDPDHKFELAVQLGDLKAAKDLALQLQSEQKWKQLADLATEKGRFDMAQDCLHRAQDFGGLLLLATSSGNRDMIGKLATSGADTGQNNVAFMSHYIRGDVAACLDLLVATGRLPEAAFFARTHLPAR